LCPVLVLSMGDHRHRQGGTCASLEAGKIRGSRLGCCRDLYLDDLSFRLSLDGQMLQSLQLQGLCSLTPCPWTPWELSSQIPIGSALAKSHKTFSPWKNFLWAPMVLSVIGRHEVSCCQVSTFHRQLTTLAAAGDIVGP